MWLSIWPLSHSIKTGAKKKIERQWAFCLLQELTLEQSAAMNSALNGGGPPLPLVSISWYLCLHCSTDTSAMSASKIWITIGLGWCILYLNTTWVWFRKRNDHRGHVNFIWFRLSPYRCTLTKVTDQHHERATVKAGCSPLHGSFGFSRRGPSWKD